MSVSERRPGRGILVAVEGPGGAGKSTATALAASVLARRAVAVLATTEPSRTDLGTLARSGTDRFRGLTLACLIAADRYHHLDVEIRPALERGRVVLCDRYLASSLVLQRMDGVDDELLWHLAREVDLPDLMILLTARPELLVERIAARGGAHSRWERDPQSSRVEASLYEAAADALRARGVYVVAMDSSATPAEAIAERIADLVADLVPGVEPRRPTA